MTAVNKILDRLERVRPVGPSRWMAACPAHEDKTPSLSIRELNDGRILLHDFGGCETADVLGAIGLQLRDLFARPLSDGEPAGGFGDSVSRIPAMDILVLLRHEILTATLILEHVVKNYSISPEGWRRLDQAAQRISAACLLSHDRSERAAVVVLKELFRP
jgi:hypothetical protein